MLISPTEFEVVPQLVLCATTLAGVLAVLVVTGGMVLLVRLLFRAGSSWKSKRP